MNAKIALGLLSCVCLAACGGNQPAPQAQPPATQAPAATTPAAGAPAAEGPGAPAAGTSAAPAAAVSEFGVPECDNYIAKYTACIDSKVPEAGRAAVRQGMNQVKASWKKIAANPDTRKDLARACTEATEAAKAGMQAYGCTW